MSKLKEEILKLALHHKLNKLAKPSKKNVLLDEDSKKYLSYEKYTQFEQYETYKNVLAKRIFAEKMSIESPFFISHDGVGSATTKINGKKYINFSSYNYLNLNGDPRVSDAAKNAIDQYGTSCSASRLVSGERPIHHELESAIAKLYETDDALVFVSGHATNLTTIGCLFGQRDLILHDELIHDSVLQGIYRSGAFRLSFSHNNWEALESILKNRRHEFERILIVIEGIYSMDGDFPELPRFIELKKKYKTFLMVDEAHSLGVLGNSGRGIAEHFNADFKDVDIWMGTLSKTLSGCGGYIAGSYALIEHLKYAAPGFVYSVGLSPALAAASLKSLEVMLLEPERILKLRENTTYFLNAAKNAGLDTGLSQGCNIVPVICSSSRKAVEKSNALRKNGINVQPIIYPAVLDNQARLRFFMSCSHTKAQLDETIQRMIE